MTRDEVEQVLFVLQEGRTDGRRFSEETIDIWCDLLADLPFEAAKAAAVHLLRTSSYPPTVADIRKMVAEMIDPLPSAEDAYLEARELARSYSPYTQAPLAASCSLIAKAISVIGIETLAYTDNSEYVGREFRRVYENLRDREIRARQIGRLDRVLPGYRAGLLVGTDDEEGVEVDGDEDDGRSLQA